MPVLHLIAGPNGAGKSTYAARLLQPVTHLPFVNADVIAAARWPGEQAERGYEASRAAADERTALLAARKSFITETVFSHPSKVELVETATRSGYLVHLHVIVIPIEVAVRRVAERVHNGGHQVPDSKIRERYARLWGLVVRARAEADRAEFFDNTNAKSPFRRVAGYEHGLLVGQAEWPAWTPAELTD